MSAAQSLKVSVHVSQCIGAISPRAHTNELFVCPILSWSDVDKIEQCLATSESTHEFFNDSDFLDGANTDEHFGKASNIGINPTDYTDIKGNVIGFPLDELDDGSVDLGGSSASALFSISDEFIFELFL